MPWTDEGRRTAVQARVQVRAAMQREHDEQVRPHLELAARLGLKGNRLVGFLEVNGVLPPGGVRGQWSRQAVRRISRRLGLR